MARSFRWPVNRTRGFSATPRRNWTRPAPAPTKSFARKVVRKAGPQEKASYWDSSFTTDGTEYGQTLLAAGSTYYPNDTSRALITYYNRRLRVMVRMKAVQNAGNFATYCNTLVYVIKGMADTLADQLTTSDANPYGRQAQMLAWQEALAGGKGIVLLAKKEVLMVHPPLQTDVNFERYAAPYEQPHLRTVWLSTRRRFTLVEGESIFLVVAAAFRHNVGGDAAAGQSALSGSYNTYWDYATY